MEDARADVTARPLAALVRPAREREKWLRGPFAWQARCLLIGCAFRVARAVLWHGPCQVLGTESIAVAPSSGSSSSSS